MGNQNSRERLVRSFHGRLFGHSEFVMTFVRGYFVIRHSRLPWSRRESEWFPSDFARKWLRYSEGDIPVSR